MTALSKFKLVLLATTALMVSGSISNAQTSSERSPAEKSAIAKPVADPSAKADPDMAKVLAVLNKLGPKPIETLTPAEARKQYSVVDAVKKVIKDERLDVDPHKGLKISNSHFADKGKLRLRYYTPEKANKGPMAAVVSST
jgi:acetyl esterase